MQGLGPAQQAPQQQPAQTPAGMQQGTPATPEQQAQFNKFVAMCTLMLYDDKFRPKAMKLLQGSQDPADGMARLGAAIVLRIYMGAVEQKQQIDPAVVIHGGFKLMEEIKIFAEASQIQGIDDTDVEAAYYIAADMVQAELRKNGIMPEESPDVMARTVGPDVISNVNNRVNGVKERMAAKMQGQQQNGESGT